MKMILTISLLGIFTFSCTSNKIRARGAASSSAIIYTEGSKKGDIAEHSAFLGYTASCYEGNPWKVRTILNNMALEDDQKSHVRTWYNKKSETIDFHFLEMKCIDDSLNATVEECTIKVRIPEC